MWLCDNDISSDASVNNRMEDLECVGLLTGPHELDRDAGDRRDRERRPTASITVVMLNDDR